VIPPMNKLLIGMIALGMLVAAPAALAVGGAVGGLMSANADAEAHYGADYSGAIAAAGDAKDKAQGTVEGAIGAATGAAGAAEASGKMTAEKSTTASIEAKSSILGGLQENLAAFGGWVSSLWVKPKIDTPTASANAAHLTKDISTEVQPGYVGADGIAHGDLTQSVGSGAGVEYNLPPPPTPKLNFAAELKMAFESFFHLG
jgi:hypothetical protein